MLKHSELFNPIVQTTTMKDEEFLKYIEICERQPSITPTRASLIQRIHDDFYDSHRDVDIKYLDHVWGFIIERIERNEGLAQFVLDYDGAKSDYFFPWLIQVFTSPSAALEMAYSAGTDLFGDWITCVPEDDEINFFVRNVPTFVYNRERQLYLADMVTSVREIKRGDTPLAERQTKIIDFGAGRLAWARWHGFEFKPESQKILAFDMDQTIEPDKLFDDRSLKDLNIVYEKNNLLEELQNPACRGADLAILGGVASYYPVELFTEGIVKPIYELLHDHGSFFFDLQLMCPAYVWSMKLFGWPEIKLSDSASQAIDLAESIRKKLWESGMRFEAEYKIDTFNESPTSVMVLFSKL